MQSFIDKTYQAAGRTPIPQGRIVVAGERDGEARLPCAANAGSILGVAVAAFGENDSKLIVRKSGFAAVEVAGPIAFGEPVNVAGTTGRAKRIDEPAGTPVNAVGFAESSAKEAGDIVQLFLAPHQRVA